MPPPSPFCTDCTHTQETFFTDPRLPFVECRSTESSLQAFRPHLHRRFSVGAVKQGRVQYKVAGKQESLEPGALAIINPEVMHSCNTLHGELRSFYMLYLDKDWCRQVQEDLWGVGHFLSAQEVKLADMALYEQYCSCMVSLLAPDIHLLEKEHLLVMLMQAVFLAVCTPERDKSESLNLKQRISPQNPRPSLDILGQEMEGLKQALAAHLQEDLTLEKLAAERGKNPATLIRQFKAYTGSTPYAYRMNCRIEKAREYLQQGWDIAETALICGFFDQSHMHRYFKSMTTVTPKQYKVNFVQ